MCMLVTFGVFNAQAQVTVAGATTGNVATEDIVWMMEGMGVSTGIDLQKLCEVADRIVALPGAQTGGRVRKALASRPGSQRKPK